MEFSESQKLFIKGLFEKLNLTISENTKTLNNTLNDKTAEIRSELKTQIGEVKEEIDLAVSALQNKISSLENQSSKLKKRVLQLERKTRKNNIIIFGVSAEEAFLWETVIGIFKNTLQIEILESDINDLYRIGKPNDNNIRPITVEFISYQKKLLVLKNSKKLKGTNIFIAKDLCWEDQEANKVLTIYKNEARRKGDIAYIKGQSLIVNNVPYTIKQLKENEINFNSPIRKADSAPPTPNPQRRQNQLVQEFGLAGKEEEEEVNIENQIIEDNINVKLLNQNKAKELDKKTAKIKIVTRSNSGARK